MNGRIVKWINYLMRKHSLEELSIALGEPPRRSAPGVLTRRASNPHRNMQRRLKHYYMRKKRFPVGGNRMKRSDGKEKS